MPSTYSLTVVNNSELTAPVFAVFAQLPATSSYDTLDLAWLTQNINPTNQYTFTWDITWGFAWSAQGTRSGYQWSGSGKLPADPKSKTGCTAEFTYINGDFELSPGNGTPSGDTLWVNDSPQVPLPSEKKSSIAVTLGGSTACATDAGPNLHQTFTLHPTYYIDAGQYVKGQMVDGSSVSSFQELAYTDGNQALTAVLQKDNTWKVQPSADVNFASMLTTRR